MNTNNLKRFAQTARRKLIEQVGAKLELVMNTDSAELREKTGQLKKLQEAINATSKQQVIDKVAYTWFNRLMALRFMDANDFQPIGVRVITPKEGYTLPELLDEAKQGHIPDDLPVKAQHIYDVLDGKVPSSNPQNEAYKELLIGACNHLHKVFPFLFERINDYTELLMPDDLISEFSIVQDIRDGMTTEDCQEVEVIGWLYQFYISEKKDEVFASKSKVKKEDIPAATQLFTPRWIVEYMVQNTVGKLWLQNNPNSKLRDHMPYFIESPSIDSGDYLKVNSVEEITLLDQACGSGHILVYGFELLTKIYEEEGYNPSEIPQLIISKNLYGFEIDERASQLAGLALMMKARSYQRRVFRKEIEPNILCYSDLKLSTDEIKQTFSEIGAELSDELLHDLENMQQATNLGSLIIPHAEPLVLQRTLESFNAYSFPDAFLAPKLEALKDALNQLVLLGNKFHCVVDNPPYMGGGNMNKDLADFVKTNFINCKTDLMACFMQTGLDMLLTGGILGMVNQQSWMFLGSYEEFRKELIENHNINSLIQIGFNSFPELNSKVVLATTFCVIKNSKLSKGVYYDLNSAPRSSNKRDIFETLLKQKSFYHACQSDFQRIPGSPIGYWLSARVLDAFRNSSLKHYATPKQGLATGDNNRFIRLWLEVKYNKIGFNHSNREEAQSSRLKWFPYSKGGGFRKWYGYNEYVVNFEDDGEIIKNFVDEKGNERSRFRAAQYYFKEAVTWGLISIDFSCRYREEGYVFDIGGMSMFSDKNELFFLMGVLNSKLAKVFLETLSPTLNFQISDISKVPIRKDKDSILTTIHYVEKNIDCSKEHWNSHETAWNFIRNELIRINGQDLDETYDLYQQYWKNKFFQLHKNEEELNRQFIEIYGLQEELTPEVPLEDITILKEETSIKNGELVFNAKEVFSQFMSYAVGCMFGRYSLDKEGLILANQGETLEDYLQKIEPPLNPPEGGKPGTPKAESAGVSSSISPLRGDGRGAFLPDDDNIIPILDSDWFEDDITGRFYEFLKVSFGKENFDKNLAFVEECLGKDIRKYFMKDFYTDHIKRYKKRPIYWMFSSPKASFNVLIYMHRYTPDTLNQILNGYLKEYKEKLNTHMEHLDHVIVTGSSVEQTKASKEKDKLKLVLMELQEYERDVLYPLATERIAIDLDDGVLVNYNKFGNAIKPVPGLNDKKTKEKVREFDWINVEEIR
ncbi:BREX-1 system adenine-specific DNA-methyltransferase PglX [uncultured Draconibacterium sp.]|uniref:BREX-1 system adenine-specific DNA-methyltransferase PglX n=1 Tax=uncultured Draconibacterium sp. TaxID=1573823 RepID=UPI0029C96270|nr:BREX-1 system adenine-specific DNA-methyltransferase PglX [uncultured Draconibacterium sp.]